MRFVIRAVWVLFTIVGLNLWLDTHEENGVLNFIGMAMVSFTFVMMIDHVVPSRSKKRYVAERVIQKKNRCDHMMGGQMCESIEEGEHVHFVDVPIKTGYGYDKIRRFDLS